MIMQMYPLLLSLALRGPSHALLAPVVVSTTHGLPGSAPWTSEPIQNRRREENPACACCAWAPLTSSALCAGSQCLAHKVTNDTRLTCAHLHPCLPRAAREERAKINNTACCCSRSS